jgi:metal-responsive CopG/Arc/MetJ family transcriptional regulator
MPEPTGDYTTKTGRTLTAADLDALAAEAEQGYDVEQLTRRTGRPRLGAAPAIPVPVRLHTDLQTAVKARAASEQTSVSDVVRRALDAYLRSEPAAVRDVTRTGHELDASEIAELASTAEAGYEIGSLRRRKHTRAEVVPVRLPPELKASVERRAELESTSVSEVIRSALRSYLDGPDPRP